MVSEEFCEWAAGRLLEQLRQGDVPARLNPGHIAWDPMLGAVRSAVRDSDLDMVRQMSTSAELVMWAAMLSRKFPADAQLTDVLVAEFGREVDVERRIGLLHHLAARELSDGQAQPLLDWLRHDPQPFIAEQRSKFSDATGPERLRDRLTSDAPAFRPKRWLYAYSAHALPVEEARSHLERIASSPLAREARAAQHSLTLLPEL